MFGGLFSRSTRPPPYFAATEYWVYLPGDKVPPQDMLMGRMVRASPYAANGEPPIGASEGILFSDIRLHVGLILKSKNPHLFRPDLFEEHIEPTAEILAALSEAQSLAKLRYVSEQPLRNSRHLQFMAYLLEASSHYGHSQAVFDVVSQRLFAPEWLCDELRKDAVATRPELHLRIVWIQTDRGGFGATRGLVKIGLPELETPESPAEHRAVICGVLEEAALQLWESGRLDPELVARFLDDEYHVRIEVQRRPPLTARILRVDPA